MAFELSQNYITYIKSPKWKLVCKRYWATYGKKCQACGVRNNLHVHHKTYERFGREVLTDLCGLCHDCHRSVHQMHRANRSISLRLVTERYVNAKKMKRL
jgi:predicted HNH restriction endonuclease